VDYLPPAITQAKACLSATGLAGWSEEIALIIDRHHKIRPYRDAASPPPISAP
jgi:hypothetical protein